MLHAAFLLFDVACIYAAVFEQIDNRRNITWLVIAGKNLSWSDHEIDTKFGVHTINKRRDLFPEWRININFQLTNGNNVGQAVQGFIRGIYSTPSPPVVLGPSDNTQTESVAAIAKYYKYPQVSQNTSPQLSDKVMYPYYSRIGTVATLFNDAAVKLMIYYKWFDVCFLSVDYGPAYAMALHGEKLLRANNITIMHKGLFKGNPTSALQSAKNVNCRIFFFFADNSNPVEDFYRFECVVFDLQIFGSKYVWMVNGYPYSFENKNMHCSWSNRMSAIEKMVLFSSPLDESYYPWPIGISNMSVSEYRNQFQVWYKTNNFSEPIVFDPILSKFDSYWAIALAINKTLQSYTWNDSVLHLEQDPFKEAFLENLRNIKFQGIAGYIQLDKNGDQSVDIIITQVIDSKVVRVGISLYNNSNVQFYTDGLKFSGGVPPLAKLNVVDLQVKVSFDLTIFVLIVGGFGMLCCACAIFFNFRFGQLRLIKLSSPRVNNLIAVGCLLGFLYVILLAIENQNWIKIPDQKIANFWARTLFLVAGFTFSFGSMFAKTWRVHLIFTNIRMKPTKINDWQLFAIVFSALLIDIVIFVVWVAVDPVSLVVEKIGSKEVEEQGTIYTYYYTSCESKNGNNFVIAFLVVKGILLFLGIYFAWETRAVRIEALNDSKQIGVCVYNIMVMAGVAVPLNFFIQSNQIDLIFGVITISIIVCQFTTLGLVFGSKIYVILKHGTNAVDDVSSVMNNSIASIANLSQRTASIEATC